MSAPILTVDVSTRGHILQVARELMQTRSYLGFSFQDIAERVGIRKASLYHHFPSKESLGVAVLVEATQGFRDWAATREGSPERQVRSYFKMLRNGLGAGTRVCPAGALVPGWDCMNEELRDAVRQLRAGQVQWLTGVLRQMPQVSSPEDVAAYVFALGQGALMAARATGQASDFDQAVAPAFALLGLPD
ncbi:TetR/AcrR family transcriptional regulator [Aquabacterium sp.]|uniref:TetR/AcrR family transcriptional regulator n=1 Tax=Aquabacterium sp. TaxID=1872578 RepID=UPI002488CCA0|nr:TetR/AcrR family transcriptional regulator [Aquabacterium sp.]MDI1257959.1 TetR/AcrR family transcriptional regulator [Aquabacterium sp.]